MPQDGLKSVIYRSFVTCDDPKGVVTCGTIRKSKTLSLKMEGKREISRRKAKSLSASLDYYNPETEEKIMASREEVVHNHSPASFQLMEVSRGAERLNHMIESWSKGVKFDGQSKDIAKDLLKGALDLQDSLIMLGKLQEASQYMAHIKKKQIMENSERGRYDDHDHDDECWLGRTRSCQIRDKYPTAGFEKPRSSFDRNSSGNSTEELKKVIRESLVSQSLLSKARKHDRACSFAQRSLDSASTSDQSLSTTGSSQSSLARPATESPTASSSSAAALQTAKGPNLIAKLMGLEEYPLRPLQVTPRRGFEGDDKVASERRPAFDIDMPKARKPQYAIQKADPERKSLKEILDTMQFKGLLRSNSANGLQPFSDHPNAPHFKERLVGEGPPIVLIKPLRVSSVETKQTRTHRPLLEEEDPLYRRKMLRTLRSREELHPKAISYKEANLKFGKIQRKSEVDGISSEGIKQEVGKEQRVIVAVPEEKEVVVKENASVKLKASRPVNPKQQRIEAIEKRADKNQKITTVNRRPLEKDVVKTKCVLKAEDQAKKISNKEGKPDSEPNVAKIQSSSKHPSTKPSAIKYGEKNAASNSTLQKKNRTTKEKPAKKPTAAKSVTKTCEREEEEKKIEVVNESAYHEVIMEMNPENHQVNDQLQLPKEEAADIYDSNIEECFSDGNSSLCDATRSTPYPDREIHGEISDQAPKDINFCISTDGKAFESESGMRALLLSSLSFQNHVEEHFDLNMNGSSVFQTSYIDGFKESSTRLYLDCAKELIVRKSIRESQTVCPLAPTCVGKSRHRFSLEMLVDEVCREIEALRKYSKLAAENLAVDGLYAMLETDLICNGFVTGIWDSGWRTGFSPDEVEQVVNDIEKLVLSGLIEEVFN